MPAFVLKIYAVRGNAVGRVIVSQPLSLLENVMEVTQGNPFVESVVLFSQADGFSQVTGILASGVTLEFKKETTSSYTTLTGFTWTEIGNGLYDAAIPATLTNEVGRFIVRVSDPSVTGWIPFLGESQVIPDDAVVTVGASYDGTTVGLSLGLERDGQAVTNPTSGSFTLYNQSGSQIASGASSSPDAQGVLVFSNALTFANNTVPYLHGSMTDISGTVTTRQHLPVVG